MMTLNDDQRMLADSVAPFMASEGAIKLQLRHWRDSKILEVGEGTTEVQLMLIARGLGL